MSLIVAAAIGHAVVCGSFVALGWEYLGPPMVTGIGGPPDEMNSGDRHGGHIDLMVAGLEADPMRIEFSSKILQQ